MDKPISMMINETKGRLLKTCNESNLHISVLQLIVKELLGEIDKLAHKCIEVEKEEYQKTISQSEGEVKE